MINYRSERGVRGRNWVRYGTHLLVIASRGAIAHVANVRHVEHGGQRPGKNRIGKEKHRQESLEFAKTRADCFVKGVSRESEESRWTRWIDDQLPVIVARNIGSSRAVIPFIVTDSSNFVAFNAMTDCAWRRERQLYCVSLNVEVLIGRLENRETFQSFLTLVLEGNVEIGKRNYANINQRKKKTWNRGNDGKNVAELIHVRFQRITCPKIHANRLLLATNSLSKSREPPS